MSLRWRIHPMGKHSRRLTQGIMSKRHILIGLVLALVAVCPDLSWAADFVARVTTVHEGDRVTIRHKGSTKDI